MTALAILAGIVGTVGFILLICWCRKMARIREAGTWKRII